MRARFGALFGYATLPRNRRLLHESLKLSYRRDRRGLAERVVFASWWSF
jgi:hypothetical protein